MQAGLSLKNCKGKRKLSSLVSGLSLKLPLSQKKTHLKVRLRNLSLTKWRGGFRIILGVTVTKILE